MGLYSTNICQFPFIKETQERALPKFKYYAKLMAELKKMLDDEIKPLMNH